MSPSKVCHNFMLKMCKSEHVLQSKRNGKYSLSEQATKRMRVSSETSEQTLHRKQQDRKHKASKRDSETIAVLFCSIVSCVLHFSALVGSVYLSVCLSVLQLISRSTNNTIYTTGNDNQFNRAGFFLNMLHCRDLSAATIAYLALFTQCHTKVRVRCL